MNIKDKLTADLFEDTLKGEYDDEEPWTAVHELRVRGTDEVFKIAVEFCNSLDFLKRERGIDVLAQFDATGPDGPDHKYYYERLEIALKLLEDAEDRVAGSAAYALAHMKGDRAIAALIGAKNHSYPDVRNAVALGLSGQNSPDAVQALIELMDDENENVRDWAAFGLGYESCGDTPQIREAFRKHLTDPFDDARDEALWGLAKRKDPQGLKLLIERLEAESWVSGDEDTALEILGIPHSSKPSNEDMISELKILLDRQS